jgi:hypothetical protein
MLYSSTNSLILQVEAAFLVDIAASQCTVIPAGSGGNAAQTFAASENQALDYISIKKYFRKGMAALISKLAGLCLSGDDGCIITLSDKEVVSIN